MPEDCKVSGPARTNAEIGSPEFAEDRTQVNSLNNKLLFDAALLKFLDGMQRSANHLADLEARGLASLDEGLFLTKRVHEKFFSGLDDRAKHDTTVRAQALRLEADN